MQSLTVGNLITDCNQYRFTSSIHPHMLVMMIISAHSLVLMQSQTVESLTMLILAIMLYALSMSILDSGQGLGLYAASHAYVAHPVALMLL